MASDFLRGVRIGLGFIVGVVALILISVFGMVMCARYVPDLILDELRDQVQDLELPQRPNGDDVSSPRN